MGTVSGAGGKGSAQRPVSDTEKFGNRFDAIFRRKDDPVKHCDVYKKEGCAHVDGMLCNMKTCDILSKFKEENKNG